MASKYAQRFSVPEAFPPILKNFTREVLRNLPPDIPEEDSEAWIYQFAAQYFKNDGIAPVSHGNEIRRLSAEELQDRITTIFKEADKDGNGVLDHKEFKTVLKAFSSELGLPMRDFRRLMAEADENADGQIEYEEFVPLAVDIIDTIYAKRRYEAERAQREAEAADRTRHFLLHGMDRSELDSVLREMFIQADSDGNGYLTRKEFINALKSSNLGLTRKEINVLLAEVDENADGRISYEEFLPLCFNLLVEIVSQDLEEQSMPRNEAELKSFFVHLLATADPEKTGLLHRSDIAELLRKADLGLTLVQLHALVSEAEADGHGMVNYDQFASTAASIVAALVDVQTSEDKADKVVEMRASELAIIKGMGANQFQEAAAKALEQAGVAVTDAGSASADAVREALVGLQLDEKEISALLSMSSTTDGSINPSALINNGFDCLRAVAEHSKITSL